MTEKTDAEKVQEVLSEREDDICVIEHGIVEDDKPVPRYECEWYSSRTWRHSLAQIRAMNGEVRYGYTVLLPFTSSDKVRFYPKDSND